MTSWRLAFPTLALATACVRVAPPASAPPTADDALARMHASLACGHAVQASGSIDQYGMHGRVRAEVMLFAAHPASIRLDVVSPFGAALATLTSDGTRFALADLREKRFYVGAATACNIGRLTTVAVPPHVLVDLLRGEAPVLVHGETAPTLAWDPAGYWVVHIDSTRQAHEDIRLAPRPSDWGLPWERQRLRVLDVKVEQQGYVLYHAELRDHAAIPTAGPRVDPDNIDPPLPPSGPPCDAEIPRKIHVEVSDPDANVLLAYDRVTWNPPLPAGTFEQAPPGGMAITPVTCE